MCWTLTKMLLRRSPSWKKQWADARSEAQWSGTQPCRARGTSWQIQILGEVLPKWLAGDFNVAWGKRAGKEGI